MRQVTATEKYNAVLEGNMARREFVRSDETTVSYVRLSI